MSDSLFPKSDDSATFNREAFDVRLNVVESSLTHLNDSVDTLKRAVFGETLPSGEVTDGIARNVKDLRNDSRVGRHALYIIIALLSVETLSNPAAYHAVQVVLGLFGH